MTGGPAVVGGVPVLVDGRAVSHPTASGRGIGRWVTTLVRSLIVVGERPVVMADGHRGVEQWHDLIDGVDVRPLDRALVREVLEESGDVAPWFVATQLMLHPVSLDAIPVTVSEAGLPVAAVMYDVIPQRYPSRYLVDAAAARQSELRSALARTVDVMLAISEFAAVTARHELALGSMPIIDIGSAVDPVFTPDDSHARARPGETVVVGGPDERKNIPRMLRAWAALDDEVRSGRRLVVVGGGDRVTRDRWNHQVVHLGISGSVRLVGSIPESELIELLRTAELSVFPSTEEGFGLPVVEAAACGCPVICSRGSSLDQVIGDPSAQFDPYDVVAMASSITAALTDADHRGHLQTVARAVATTWTVEALGHRVADALRDHRPESTRQPIRPPRRRIAVGAETLDRARELAAHRAEPVSSLLVGGTGLADLERSSDLDEALRPVGMVGRDVGADEFDLIVLDDVAPASTMTGRRREVEAQR